MFHGFRACWLPEGGDAGRREAAAGQGAARETGARAALGTAVGREKKRPRAESRKAKRSRPAGRQAGRQAEGWQAKGERIGDGRVIGESVRGVARWYGNERFRGPVGGQAGG